MPAIGFGVFKIAPQQVIECVGVALASGYRLIDTAAAYGNEQGVGLAIARSGIPRSELFVTTKLWNSDHGYDPAIEAFDQSLTRLRLEYVDLYLIHWPIPMHDKYVDTWRALERIYLGGRARAIGVSNFGIDHLGRLLAGCEVVPAVNQIEVHPGFHQDSLRGYCRGRGIAIQSWGPLGQGKGILADPTIRAIAVRIGKSPAQVVLRWHLQRGSAPIPKSVTPARIRENLDVFDFALGEEDMIAISSVGSGNDRLGPDPDTFDAT
jgi:diketogulonate reductase-like aldo/keto reductase